MVRFPVGAEAWVVLGVDVVGIHAQPHAQTGFFDARGDHAGATDQDGVCQVVVNRHLRRAQRTLVFAVGKGHALLAGWRCLGNVENGLHQDAGLRHEARQAFAVGLHVSDGARSHTTVGCGLCHGGGNAQNQARVKRLGDQVVRAKCQLLPSVGSGHFVAGFGLGQVGNLAHASQFHFFGDFCGPAVQCTPEDVREAQHVVHLVGVVRPAGGNDAVRADGFGQFRANFRLGVGQCQDDGSGAHGLDHFGGQYAGGRATQKHVGTVDHIGQGACCGVLCVAGLRFVVATWAALVDHAFAVAHIYVFGAGSQAYHHVQTCDGRCASARHGNFHVANGFVDQFKPVKQCSAGDDGGAVLVVVEHRNAHALAQLFLNVEALGRFDVFQVDAAQRGLQCGDHVHQFVGVALGQLDVEHVNARKLLEQAALAFHDGFAGQRADVAQAQHRCAIGDDAHQVAPAGVLGCFGWIGRNFQTRVGHAG